MVKRTSRAPHGYDGTNVTSREMKELLPAFVSRLGRVCQDNPQMIIDAWPDVIGEQLSKMTQALSFVEGVLTVKVRNSTLHSILSRNDKDRIIAVLKKKFPQSKILNIVFRIG